MDCVGDAERLQLVLVHLKLEWLQASHESPFVFALLLHVGLEYPRKFILLLEFLSFFVQL